VVRTGALAFAVTVRPFEVVDWVRFAFGIFAQVRERVALRVPELVGTGATSTTQLAPTASSAVPQESEVIRKWVAGLTVGALQPLAVPVPEFVRVKPKLPPVSPTVIEP
jgi:hypothetical protein